MVQPSEGLRLRQPGRRGGRRGRIRAHGNGAQCTARRASAGPAVGGEDRVERQGPDRRRIARLRTFGLLAFAAVTAVPAACSAGSPAAAVTGNGGQTGLVQVPLTIHSATGVHRFTVEIAATPQQQEQGLMFRRSLAPNHGMIFPYDPPQEVGFWMRNTLIPLDMVFIRADGRIARIATAKPLDESIVPSGEPIAVVLELAGGRAAELGIAAGDR